MADLWNTLMQECDASKDAIITWRRHIHENPELGFQEHQTVAYIRSVLESFECPALTMTNPLPTALVAELKGSGGEGPIVAMRADIDALPLVEDSGEPFSSKKHGVMHACGHDAHTTMLLGAIKVLCGHVAEIKGTARFMFQHAEEIPPGGAREMVAKGVMDNVKAVYGLHVAPILPTGAVATKKGPMSAAADNFTIIVKGRGGHASMPNLVIDPVPIAAEIVLALQTIVSRKIDPNMGVVISIPTMTTGAQESHNVIPNEVKLLGTIRSLNKEARRIAHETIPRIATHIAEAHEATADATIDIGYEMVDNDAEVTENVMAMAARVLGSPQAVIVVPEPIYGGEDFSSFQTAAPGTFMAIGTGNKDKGITAVPHSTKFRVDEDALPIGAKLHCGFVYTYLIDPVS